jgi:hypothetical protein
MFTWASVARPAEFRASSIVVVTVEPSSAPSPKEAAMSEQAFWYDGGPRDPDYLETADSTFGSFGFEDEDEDEDEDYLPN